MDLAARALLSSDDSDSESDIEWEEVDCLLCGGGRWSPLVEAPDPGAAPGRWFMVVQCLDCGLCFTNPRPSAATIGRFYPRDYPPHQFRGHIKAPRWWQRLPLVRRCQDPRHLLPVFGGGQLLDFGCGGDAFLQRMRRQGWNVVGLDAAPEVRDRLEEELGIPALVGSLPHPQLADEAFDLITMWQALEHVHQPMEVLRGAYRHLAPGGRLLAAVPNIDSLPFRWFGAAWSGLDLPRHLTHFAPETLRLMLHRAGFRSIQMRMVRRSGWLQDSARLAARLHPKPPRHLRWLRHKTAASLVSWHSYLTRQADCIVATANKQ